MVTAFKFFSRNECLKLHIPVMCISRVHSIAMLMMYVFNSAVCDLWRRNCSDTCVTGESIFKFSVEKMNLINVV